MHTATPRAWQSAPVAPPVKTGPAFLPLMATFLCLGGLITSANYLLLGVTLPDSTLIGTLLALIPLSALSWYFAWLDSGEVESRRMFLLAFLWGSVGATGIAMALNTVSVEQMGTLLGVGVFAPAVEESLKGLLLFFLFWWRRSHFDGPLDGIVYAGFIGMGFAFVENITYFTASYSGLSVIDDVPTEGGFLALLSTFIMRGVFTLFAHPLFTAATGIGLGLAMKERDPRKKFFLGAGGLVAAIALHAVWNSTIVVASMTVVITVYLCLFVPLFLLYLWYSYLQHQRTTAELNLALRDLVHYGVVPQSDMVWLSHRDMRRTALAHAKKGGKREATLMRAYLYYAMRFAALHATVRAGVQEPDYLQRGRHYSYELQQLRRELVWPPVPRPLLPHRPSAPVVSSVSP